MPDSEKDRAADEVAMRRATFDLALSNKRIYPVQEFRAFVQSARRYIAMTKNDPMIHKSVARAVNGLREYLAVERRRIPGDVLFEADLASIHWHRSFLLPSVLSSKCFRSR